jgi:hypothetical protein
VPETSLFRWGHDAWTALAERHRWLQWAAKWGISAASLLLGIVTLAVFRRGAEYFPWILGYLILLWVGAVVFAHVRKVLELRDRRLARLALDFTIQNLHQDLLLFLLPIYYAATTLSSGNVVFLLLLGLAALLTTIDPWYQATVLRYPLAGHALFAFGLFASLNVGLPLIRLRSAWALVLSALLSLLALTPAIRRGFALSWSSAMSRTALMACVGATLLWFVRGWIPPGALHLSVATFARSVEMFEPVEPVRTVPAAELQTWGGLVCYTAVSAPAGLREPIYHLWRKDGVQVGLVALSPIRGGRPGGYRTYSKRSDLGADLVGHWTVDVLTVQGQLIGRVRLLVTS